MREAIYRIFVVFMMMILLGNSFFTGIHFAYAEEEGNVENGGGNGGREVTYCHVPPGNPNNPQTLTTSYNAYINGHSNHSLDYLGECRRPDIVLRKTAGDPVEAGNGYYIEYTMEVGNNGTGTGYYNLNDEVEVPDGVSVSVDFLSFDDDDDTSPPEVNEDFNGVDKIRIITNETILPDGLDTYKYKFHFEFDDTVTPDGEYCNGELGRRNTVKVINKLRYNRRGDPQEVCTDLYIPEPKGRTVRIFPHKVECARESDLPNWGAGGPNITEDTASDYVDASNGRCRLVRDWDFEWSYEGSNPGDTFYGEAGDPWNTFSGPTSVEVPDNNRIWMREVLKDDYIPFTYGNNNNNSNDESAEFYCHNDVLNYDNLDFVDVNEEDDVYYCAAFNTKETRYLKPAKPLCKKGKRYAKYVPNEEAGGFDTVDDTLWVGDYVAPVGQWFEVPNDTDTTFVEEGAVILFDGPRVVIDLITAKDNNDTQHFAGHLKLFGFELDGSITEGRPGFPFYKLEPGHPDTISADGTQKIDFDFRVTTQIDEASFDTKRKKEECRDIVKIHADKVECKKERHLPNWGNGGPNITKDTAADYVADSDGNCRLVDWEFQWSLTGSNPGDTFYGEAGDPWNTFSDYIEVEVPENKTIWMREVLEEEYIPFTYGENNNNSDDKSAEFYCHNDVSGYDNYDFVETQKKKKNYYCVGFNTKKHHKLPIAEPICEDGKRYAKYTPNEDAGGFDTVDNKLWVGDYVAPVGEWFEIPSDADTSDREEGALLLFDGPNVVIDLITAKDNNDRQDFAGELELFGLRIDGAITEGRPGFPFYKLENGGFHTDSVSANGNKKVEFDFAVTTQIDEASFDTRRHREECRDDVTIHADKVECVREAYLPNWGKGGPNITKNTAANYVASSDGKCRLVDWEFQWSYDGSNPGDTFYGEAGDPWETFTGSVEVENPENGTIWMREVLEEGYIPFTYEDDNSNNSDKSAEFYCHNDVSDYDNYDFVKTKKKKKNYYCVGFNTKKYPRLPIAEPVCQDGKRYMKYVPNEEAGGFDTVDDKLWVGDYIAPIGDWFELPDDADTSSVNQGALILYDGTKVTIDLITAVDNNDRQHFAGELELFGHRLDGDITEGRPGFPFYKLEPGHPDTISAINNRKIEFDFRVTTQIDEASFNTKFHREKCGNFVNIHADKVECVAEEYLPNWGEGGPNITKNTAENYVADSDGKCRLVDWEFQWSYDGSNPGDTFYGEAGDPWETFTGSIKVENPENNTIWMREVLQNGYIPFTYGENNNNSDDDSAEFYCHNDVLNYDNYDFVKTKKNKKNYYCVGFNTKSRKLPVAEPICEDGKRYMKYVPDEETGGFDTVDDILWVGDYEAPVGDWFELPNDAGTSSVDEGALILYDGTRMTIDLITAVDNNDRQHFAGELEFFGARVNGNITEGRPGFPFYKLEGPNANHPDSISKDGNQKVVFDFRVTTQIDEASFDIRRKKEQCNNTVKIHADKVVCDRERFLPNWGKGGPNITKDTAADYVANSNGRCRLEDWDFQWNYDGSNPGDTFYGEASDPWETFTDYVEVEVPENRTIWMREVLENNYIPFTYEGDNTNESDRSAEFYCHRDVLNYDNLDFVKTNDNRENYYCVGFNTRSRRLTVAQPVCEDGKRYMKYVPNEAAGGFDTVDDRLWVGNYIAPIDEWFELPNDVASSVIEEGAVILYDGTTVTMDLITAQNNNNPQHFAGHLELYGARVNGAITEGRPGFPFYKLEGPNANHPDSISKDGNQKIVFDFRVTTQVDEASFDIRRKKETCDNGDNGDNGDSGDNGDNGSSGGGDDDNGPITRSSGGGGTNAKSACNQLDPNVYTSNSTGNVTFTCHGNYKTQAFRFSCGNGSTEVIKTATIDGSDRYAEFSCDYGEFGSYTPVCSTATAFTDSPTSELWETQNSCEGDVTIVNEVSQEQEEEQVETSGAREAEGNDGSSDILSGGGSPSNELQETYDNYLDLLEELEDENTSNEREDEIRTYTQGLDVSQEHKLAISRLISNIESLDEDSQKLVIQVLFDRLMDMMGNYLEESAARKLIDYLKLRLAIAYFN